jgi:hypothetical protein
LIIYYLNIEKGEASDHTKRIVRNERD